jgi:hypothetical protein
MLIKAIGEQLQLTVSAGLHHEMYHQAEFSLEEQRGEFEDDASPDLRSSFDVAFEAMDQSVVRGRRAVIKVPNHPSVLRWIEGYVQQALQWTRNVDTWNWPVRLTSVRAMAAFDSYFVVPDDVRALANRAGDWDLDDQERLIASLQMNAFGWRRTRPLDGTDDRTVRYDPVQARIRFEKIMSATPRPISAHQALALTRATLERKQQNSIIW